MTILFGYSLKPLRLLTATGLTFTTLSVLAVVLDFILYLIHSQFFVLNSILSVVTFFSGLILTSLGLVGEYVGRIFMVQSGLPQYVEKTLYLPIRENIIPPSGTEG